jgi:elongation factor G
MGKYSPESIRNIALVGHGNCGKTSLTESFLTVSKSIERPGSVDEGTSKTDYGQDEIERGISINTVPATCNWDDKELNVLDTPGFFDFLPEVKFVLSAVDGAVLVVDGVSGAEAGTEKTFAATRDYDLPLLVFVSKMDKENADYDKALASLSADLDGTFAPFVIPVGQGLDFKGVVDVVHNKAYKWDSTKGVMVDMPLEGEAKAKAAEYREALLEAAADTNDALAEKYLEGEEVTDELLISALRSSVGNGTLFPVLCGASLGNAGVQRLIELIFDYLPSAVEKNFEATVKGEVVQINSKNEGFCGQIFKTLVEPHLGELALIRIVHGSITSGDHVLNSTRDEKEKIGTMYKVRGKERIETDTLTAGEMGALVKLKFTKTGDTLCSVDHVAVMKELTYPEPLISVAVEPATNADQEKLSTALAKLVEEDPAMRVRYDTATHQTLVEGNGEVQLNILLKRLKDRYKVNVNLKDSKIAYKETIRGTAKAQGRHKKQSGGRGQFGDVWLEFEHFAEEDNFVFVDAIVGGVVPGRFIPAVEKGLRESFAAGPLAGFPVTQVKVTLYDGSYHAVDSSEVAFKMAAGIAVRTGMPNAKPVLLEPIMDVSVIVPERFMGDIMGDINTRRGKIQGMDPMRHKQRIRAKVPQAEMDKYIVTLRSMTEGRGEYSMKFSHYEEVPHAVTEAVIAKIKKDEAEEE